MHVQRFDYVSARINKIERTPSGGVRISAHLSRTGVQKYERGDGSEFLEYRPPAEVFHPAALASFAGAAVTIDHPVDWVRPENWASLSVGHVGDTVAPEGDLVASRLSVDRADAIARVTSDGEDRLVELSCGYTCDLDMTPGVSPEGERYDAVQRNIRGNHVALLPPGAGRAGPRARLHMDAAACISRPNMAKHKIEGVEYDAGTPEHLAAVDKSIAKGVVELATAQARADKAEAASSPVAIQKRIDQAVKIKLAAARYLDKEDAPPEGAAAEGDDAILLKILAKALPGLDFGKLGLSHEQLLAMLDQVMSAEDPAATEDPNAAPPVDAAANPAAPKTDAGTQPTAAKLRSLPANPAFGGPFDAPIDLDARAEAARLKRADRWKIPTAR